MMQSDAMIKESSERNKEPLTSAVEYAESSIKIMEGLVKSAFGEAAPMENMQFCLKVQQLGDAYKEMDEVEKCEAEYIRCQTVIGNTFGESHAAIIPYNSNLVQLYMHDKFKEQHKEKVKQIVGKNIEIARATFDGESIHLLYHISTNMINKIALGEILTPTMANPLIKEMRSIITKFHDGNVRDLNNQIFFQVQLLYAQLLSGSMQESVQMNVEILKIVSEIYTYVISSQVKYVRLNMKHPFLEQTYMNIAIFNRSLKKFSDSLMMWKRLEALQKDLYGEESPILLFTFKNIGTCYLGVG